MLHIHTIISYIYIYLLLCVLIQSSIYLYFLMYTSIYLCIYVFFCIDMLICIGYFYLLIDACIFYLYTYLCMLIYIYVYTLILTKINKYIYMFVYTYILYCSSTMKFDHLQWFLVQQDFGDFASLEFRLNSVRISLEFSRNSHEIRTVFSVAKCCGKTFCHTPEIENTPAF